MYKTNQDRPGRPRMEYPQDANTLRQLYRYFQREASLLRRLTIEAEQREYQSHQHAARDLVATS
jgi:hypothetical protein